MWIGTGGREEEGLFYGVNLQGTNLLMLCARLGGKNMPISGLHREEISIPAVVLAGTSQVFLHSFDLPPPNFAFSYLTFIYP